MKIYCDTNIFLDFFEQRSDKLRPLGAFAFDCFSNGWNCRFNLVISDWVTEEFDKHSKKEINDILEQFRKKEKLIFVNYDENDKKRAKSLSKNWQDALHAIIAGKEKCDFLVTRNIKDFSEFQHIVDITLPESV